MNVLRSDALIGDAAASSRAMTSVNDWEALDKMFQDGIDAADTSCEAPKPSYGKDAPVKVSGMTPGMIGPAMPKPVAPAKKSEPSDPNAIWSEAELAEAGDPDDIDDGRPQPEYEIVFKQNVRAEDMYLGVDPLRHAGISCSDELVLKVTLPETKLAEIDLDVRPTVVRLQSPKYRLKVQLGERVDENKGNAKWDADKSLLTVRPALARSHRPDALEDLSGCRAPRTRPPPFHASPHALYPTQVNMPIIPDMEGKMTISASNELD